MSSSASTDIQQILHRQLPNPSLRKRFYASLQRNVAYLPMFPEPKEHASFGLIRYVDRVFGPLLDREWNGSTSSTAATGIGVGIYGGGEMPVSHPQHCLEQHASNTMDHRHGHSLPSPSSPSFQTHTNTTYTNNNSNYGGNSASTNNKYGGPTTNTTIFADDHMPPLECPGGPMFPPPNPTQMQHHAPLQQQQQRQQQQQQYDAARCISPPIPITSNNNNHSINIDNNNDHYNYRNGSTRLSIQIPPPSPYHSQTPRMTSAGTTADATPSSVTGVGSSMATMSLYQRHHPPQQSNLQSTMPTTTTTPQNYTTNMTSSSLTTPHQFSSLATPLHSNMTAIAAASLPLQRSRTHLQSSLPTPTPTSSSTATATAQFPDPSLQQPQPQHYTFTTPINSPPPQPLPFFKSPRRHSNNTANNNLGASYIGTKSLLENDSSSNSTMGEYSCANNNDDHDDAAATHGVNCASLGRIARIMENENDGDGDAGLDAVNINSREGHSHRDDGDDDDDTTTTPTTTSALSSSAQQYQLFSLKGMFPPILPREKILYYPPPSALASSKNKGNCSPCCLGSGTSSRNNASGINNTNNNNSNRHYLPKKRPPTYLQVYIKCERSEPLLQPSSDMDIVTWYQNENNQVTADRTLVVRGTTTLFDFIKAAMQSFGILTDQNNNTINVDGTVGIGEAKSTTLGCYNDICFISDVKSSSNQDKSITLGHETPETHLTPLPIPGMYYKFVDREVLRRGRTNRKNQKKEGSSVLSTDPAGLQRTLIAQLLDKPIYPKSNDQENEEINNSLYGTCIQNKGSRTRLALVYCTPKRESYVSARTQRGILPETIYHFQILLEGIVEESDLPSSFQSQIATRCVGATGGVQGGSIMDTDDEIDDLNRQFWGQREVIGLVTPSANRDRDLEQIIGLLGVALFDNSGKQTLKEFVVDKCLYHIASGNLSMEVARKTKHTVEAMQGTTEWLAKQVGQWTNSLTQTAEKCFEEDDLVCVGEEFDAAVSKVVRGNKKKSTRFF